MDLPRPGAVGITIRLLLAGLVGFMGYAVFGQTSMWDGITPMDAAPLVMPLVLFSSWVINELFRVRWGFLPSVVVLGGLAITAGVEGMMGTLWGPAFGIYVWTWSAAFVILLGPAHLLAAILRTPGCEMRSYAHLWTRIQGGDPNTAVCPGWIDRFDAVRLFGRW